MINSFTEFLSAADTAVFRFLNGRLTCDFLDVFMPFVTRSANFTVPFAALFLALVIFGKYRGRVAAAATVIGVAAADVISSRVLKYLVGRPRPFETLENVRQLVGAAGYSMPSSHAFNSFAAATMFALFFDKKLPEIKNPAERFLREKWAGLTSFFLAFLSAYSRIYVGVHYPFDSLAGMLGGILTGYLFWRSACFVSEKYGRTLR